RTGARVAGEGIRSPFRRRLLLRRPREARDRAARHRPPAALPAPEPLRAARLRRRRRGGHGSQGRLPHLQHPGGRGTQGRGGAPVQVTRSLAVFLLLVSLLVLGTLGVRPLYKSDESRYAEIPREMVASGDWI